MAHREHPSWKAGARKAKPVKNWAKHYTDMAQEANARAAEGQFRVQETRAPMKYDEWFDNHVADIEARNKAIEEAEQD